MNLIEALKKDGIETSIKDGEFTFVIDGKIVKVKKETLESLLYATMLTQLKMLSSTSK